MKSYGTKNHYTSGESDFEAGIKGDEQSISYVLKRRDPNKSKDISGFCFRKDLCSFPPQNADSILSEVHSFAKNQGIESVLDKNRYLKEEKRSLTLNIGRERYGVSTFIDEGYAGEISIDLLQMPAILLK